MMRGLDDLVGIDGSSLLAECSISDLDHISGREGKGWNRAAFLLEEGRIALDQAAALALTNQHQMKMRPVRL